MNERLLQFIWQHQYFNTNELVLTDGESLRILHAGTLNTHQGPDFMQARIQVGQIVLAGHIELHIKTSDWRKHRHDEDENYRNVILHVVWQHDLEISLYIPVLILESRISNILLDQYDRWMQQPNFIPCNTQFAEHGMQVWNDYHKILLKERLLNRSMMIRDFLNDNNQHWEESFWWWLARHFGTKVNASAFESTARSLPVTLIAKHKSNIIQLEALLFGQSGLLSRKFKDDYALLLQKEYRFLQRKYKLKQSGHPLYFLRMRPGNFPTIRLAQLAMLIHQWPHLFSAIREASSLKDLRKLLDVTASDYWSNHYLFEEPSSFKVKHIGEQMIDSLIINAICPAIFAYGNIHQESAIEKRAINWLLEIDPEENAIINGYLQLGVVAKNASESQALLQLKSNYCDQKKCLDCSIGNVLLKNATL